MDVGSLPLTLQLLVGGSVNRSSLTVAELRLVFENTSGLPLFDKHCDVLLVRTCVGSTSKSTQFRVLFLNVGLDPTGLSLTVENVLFANKDYI